MKKTMLLGAALVLNMSAAKATPEMQKCAKKDPREEFVLRSKTINSILKGLKSEQGLKCHIVIEESGCRSIEFYSDENFNRFRAAYLCDDGRSAIFEGIFGDGGQVATDKFQMVYGG